MVVERRQHPWDINNGECEDFAVELVTLLKQEGIQGEDMSCNPDELPAHIWVYVPELKMHFDPETPYGEDCFLKLPIFLRFLSSTTDHPGEWTREHLRMLNEDDQARPLLMGKKVIP